MPITCLGIHLNGRRISAANRFTIIGESNIFDNISIGVTVTKEGVQLNTNKRTVGGTMRLAVTSFHFNLIKRGESNHLCIRYTNIICLFVHFNLNTVISVDTTINGKVLTVVKKYTITDITVRVSIFKDSFGFGEVSIGVKLESITLVRVSNVVTEVTIFMGGGVNLKVGVHVLGGTTNKLEEFNPKTGIFSSSCNIVFNVVMWVGEPEGGGKHVTLSNRQDTFIRCDFSRGSKVVTEIILLFNTILKHVAVTKGIKGNIPRNGSVMSTMNHDTTLV
mmetsp:Transcript_12313/g.17972  ORF Transcript_12313/g.17972 Transcript_12313/m.17972 type:complete len:277 (+) Transcript_12313:2403-3233(+)